MTSIFSERPWWRGIAPGSTVTYSTPQGNVRSGKVVISTPTHVVLNTGGRHGTTAVVNDGNYLMHKEPPTPRKKKE